MAIQLPNPGLGDGKTGDNEYVMWTKVKENFSNPDHAASKLVGTADGQIPTIEGVGYDGKGLGGAGYLSTLSPAKTGVELDSTSLRAGFYACRGPGESTAEEYSSLIHIPYNAGGFAAQIFGKSIGNGVTPYLGIRGRAGGVWTQTATVYHTMNTTKEEDTGYLVASSPVLKIQHDSFEKVHEAEQLEIEVNNIKTGVYEITGTTGLREGDGWNLKPPKDVNGNVLCICEATESNGVITLKTYKKKFDFETVSIVADYEQPTDIPEGAVVMLRFNDLPQEELDEPIE